MDIGIVTSFYNHYDRFLPQWTKSIIELHTKPNMVTMVVSGPDFSDDNILVAKQNLEASNIPYQVIYLPEHKGMGFARNESVRNTNTKWIMYLDVDDVILPNAIDNYMKYENMADVIAGGLRITGVKGDKEVLFDSSREKALRGDWVSCSHGVYKKSFWERSPYITQNDFVDQVLWLGFAQDGAEFIGTKEICTVYIRRKDGHNLSMSTKDWEIQKEQWKDFIKNGVYPFRARLQIKEKMVNDGIINMYYYTNETNFGDLLAPIIVEWISGYKVNLVDKEREAKLLAVGSVMSRVRKHDVVWGTGIISAQVVTSPQDVVFLAVRGPLTKKLITGADVPEVYGDPALLMPKIYNPTIEKKYEVGYIPHYVDQYLFTPSDDRILFIDVTNPDPFETINKILSCDVIISTSLHGIIVAEAYGIPAVWLKLSDKIIGNGFKFRDYLMSTGSRSALPMTLNKVTDKDLLSISKNTLPKPVINVEPLIKAWEDYFGNSKQK